MITVIKPYAFAQVVKGTAKMILPLTSKKEKLQKKIVELALEIQATDAEIDRYQGHVKEISGGLTTEQLVVRKKDLEGKYIAGFDANPAYVTFDEEKRVYMVDNHVTEETLTSEEAEALEAHMEAQAKNDVEL